MTFDAARTIDLVVAISYIISALVLGVMRSRGGDVPYWVIGGWLVTGVLGVLLALMLAPGRGFVWAALLFVLVPWMIYALIGDVRLGHYLIAVIDALALIALTLAAIASYSEAWRAST